MAELENETETLWIKHSERSQAAILGKDIVVLSSGSFITFVDLFGPDKKDVLYNPKDEVREDGIQCLCTHKFLQYFAFSERCRNPQIFVVSYPSFEVYKRFKSVKNNCYVEIKFSEMEFLVALTGVPDYKIVIWNWRTGEKLYCQETELNGPDQILRVSPTSPVQIIQWDFNEKKIVSWEMRFCYKKTLLNKTPVSLPDGLKTPCSLIYGADGDAYFVDSSGSLYSINSETHFCSQQYSFTESSCPDFIPCMTWYKGGIVFTTPAEVLFLRRKSPEGWSKIWSFVPKTPFRVLMASSVKDLLAGITTRNEIVIMKGDTQVECVNVRHFGANFEFVCFVNPVGDFFVTFGNSSNVFTLWNKVNGQKISQLSWQNEKINALASNPKWPYLVAVTEEGWVYAINAYEASYISELDRMRLSSNRLEAIRFRGQGSHFCVANMEVGEFFLLKIPARLEVTAYVKVDLKIVDYVILEKETPQSTCLLIVPMSQMCCRSGQTVFLYALNEPQKRFEYLKNVTLPLVITSFVSSPLSPKEIICVLHRSRKLCIMNFLTGKVISEHVSGHQMKIISMRSRLEYLFTYGIDGIFIVKMMESKKCATVFATHHRLLKGIRNFAVDPYVSFVLTVGSSGALVCTELKKLGNYEKREEYEELMSSPAYKQLLQTSSPSRGKRQEKQLFIVSYPTKTPWVELRQQEMLNLEEQQNIKEKQSIFEEFQVIKRKLCQLLDENLSNIPERQLPIQAFDLDKAARRKKIEDSKIKREKLKYLQLASMKSLSKVTDLIKKVCWDSVAVKGREIHGIVAPLSVQSYALLPPNKAFDQNMAWLAEKHKLRHYFQYKYFFEPWIPAPASDLKTTTNNLYQVTAGDVTQTTKTKREEEPTEQEHGKVKMSSEDQELKNVWSGTSSYNFIEVDFKHFSQFELMTFHQAYQEMFFIQSDIKKLMLWFNKNFAETFDLKEQEMAFIREQNNKLRHIIKELSFFNFSPHICSALIFDPEWGPEENPENIITVQDSEIKVPKYISTSEMDLIKKREAEEERLRKVMMADDFKERALMTMMDGVLEKLWEDELKKDVSKPKCMTEKEPDAYTEEDLKAIKAYEAEVKFLRIERERYRKILERDWAKTTDAIRDSVAKFDEKVAHFHLLKLKVESAIGQEILKALRIRLNCQEKLELDRKEDFLKSSLAKNEKKMQSIIGELNKLVEMLNECKNLYETLQNKDKNMDKNFKKEFSDYPPIVCEQLYKVSKKRPKLMQKAAMYSTVLIDLGKCAVAGIKPEYMPAECIQYLKDLDILDAYSNAPGSITQQSWELACKLRRSKIDAELKVRACAIDLTDAEATVASFQKSIKAARDHHSQLQNDLQGVRQKKATTPLNYQIQLVLKKGLVEIPLSGRISDFEESILVTKKTVGDVNNAIHKMGGQKIKAMNKAKNFRKGIIFKEWEHKKLRMEIEDLKQQLDTIEKLQVLKELQALLVARARGFPDDKGFSYLENELLKIKEKFQAAQTDVYKRMDEFEAKIEKLNGDNKELDVKIMELNVEVNEMNLTRDLDFDKKNIEENMKKMKKVRERSQLVRKIQEQHNEILLLQTELELLRLKTYPAIKYKIT